MTLERFLALAPKDDRNVYVNQKPDRALFGTRTGYRKFAAWITGGDQPGLHLRGFTGVASTQFRGNDSNWIYHANPDWEAVPALLDEARKIASQRGGGRSGVKVQLY